jgi:hypothetical protein
MLGEDGTYTGAASYQLQFSAVVRGEEEEKNAGHHVAESGGGFQAIHLRHGEIENDQVGGELLGFFDGVNSVNSLATNGEFGISVEKRTELPTNDLVIVHDQN